MLNVDQFFFDALSASDDITDIVSDRIFNPARTFEEEEADVVPYIIISYDGGNAGDSSEDSIIDTVTSSTVSVLVVADSRDDLAELVETVSDTIVAALTYDSQDYSDYRFTISSVTESAGAVSFDPDKPCCYQSLTYQCDCSDNNS